MNLTDICKAYEHYETSKWAARAILDKEETHGIVIDPCTGTGVLAEEAKKNRGRGEPLVVAIDIFDYGYPLTYKGDFLKMNIGLHYRTVFMNPPFSKACEFVAKALDGGARKVICFQRLAWFESRERNAFFNMYPPDRIWLCGDRATMWRHDISEADRKVHPVTGKKRSGSTTAHAWFIFDRGSPVDRETTIGKIWKLKGEK